MCYKSFSAKRILNHPTCHVSSNEELALVSHLVNAI